MRCRRIKGSLCKRFSLYRRINMNRFKLSLGICIVLFVMLVCIALGYMIGYYARCLAYANEREVRAYSALLLIESLRLTKLEDSSPEYLLDCLESNGAFLEAFVANNRPYCSARTQEKIDEAMTAWKEALEKVKQLRTRYTQ